jgi:hypothetical protein
MTRPSPNEERERMIRAAKISPRPVSSSIKLHSHNIS